MQTNTLLRRTAAGLGLAAALSVAVAGTASASPAAATAAAPAPSFDFTDCPAIPAGADAAQWKCEVLTATGSLKLGNRTLPEFAPMTITHAEGPMPDGSKGQVWGALRSGPTAVPGGLFGNPAGDRSPVLGLSVQPEYGGRSDFYSVGDDMGLFTLRYRVLSPLLPQGCVIGAGDAPVEIRLKRVGRSERISKNPPVIKFSAADGSFAVPAAEGCGPLGKVLNDKFGLPAGTGNSITLSALYTFRTYDQLPPR
ncbi:MULTISPECIES: hypothetical protein [Streptomyces]|uniref:hypothetical protein n=1 Tax=Streptomyces TaxID=1883 RepID=UPI000F79A8EF|nr:MULTISPECIES: hypothetical protein [Streptomyces]RSS99225.1 hypothetical protein EF910_36230 [Streptomyces sp. WAC07149]GLX21744.1 hypothetical protein Slala01_53880 [Streptomyces lavendulae subsp. lavendulae]GLX28377.1 hypothetical protein Slala02_41970 [Streptomyces lavendulae subsp. lavendulae]